MLYTCKDYIWCRSTRTREVYATVLVHDVYSSVSRSTFYLVSRAVLIIQIIVVYLIRTSHLFMGSISAVSEGKELPYACNK